MKPITFDLFAFNNNNAFDSLPVATRHKIRIHNESLPQDIDTSVRAGNEGKKKKRIRNKKDAHAFHKTTWCQIIQMNAHNKYSTS